MEEYTWLTIGEIVAPYGLKGEVKINPSSDFPERFLKPGTRWIQGNKEDPKKVSLQRGRRPPGRSIYIVYFSEINTREKAELVIGKKLLVPISERPALKKNEFHFLDLIGLKVKVNTNKESIGEITNLISAGNDLIEVKLNQGRKILIPFVKDIVPEVNIKKSFIVINPPKGLLEL